jgi:hypothetical protein
LLGFYAGEDFELPLQLLDLVIFHFYSVFEIGDFLLGFGADALGPEIDQEHLIHIDLLISITQFLLHTLYNSVC